MRTRTGHPHEGTRTCTHANDRASWLVLKSAQESAQKGACMNACKDMRITTGEQAQTQVSARRRASARVEAAASSQRHYSQRRASACSILRPSSHARTSNARAHDDTSTVLS
eukprot:3579742-Pleurochrysis_carterae.AAC.8